jgi:proteasome lid subunit RPN8/RPN11
VRGAIAVPRTVRAALIAHARRERPRECCGLLLGRRGLVLFAVPMRNVAAGVSRYRIDDAAHIALRRLLRDFVPALAIVGVYHSHPRGVARPSPTDVAGAFYREWVHVIVGLAPRAPVVRAYRITKGRARTVPIAWRGPGRRRGPARPSTPTRRPSTPASAGS